MNTIYGVIIDGYVMSPVHDLQVVIRGTEESLQCVIVRLRQSIECDFRQKIFVRYFGWPSAPSFKIKKSISK